MEIPTEFSNLTTDNNRTTTAGLLFHQQQQQLLMQIGDFVGNASGGAHSGSNASDSSDPFGRNEEIAKIEITVLSITFLVAVAGNASVLLALCKTRRKLSRMHLFIRHLSLADLVVAFFQVLPQLCWEVTFRFSGPDALCRVVKHLQVAGMFASTYMMVMMTVDRYIAVCHPLQTLRRPARRAHAMIASAWALSLVLSLPQYGIFSLSEVTPGSRVYDCWGHFVEPWGVRAYITWITAGIFVVPVSALVLCYGFICHAIWRNLKYNKARGAGGGGGGGPGAGGGGPGARAGSAVSAEQQNITVKKNDVLGRSSVSGISRAKLRTVKMTFVIVLAYVVCWTPFFTVQMWSVWDETFSWDDSENTVVTLSALLASLNSCCNPWIYMIFSGHLLSDFLHCLPCCCCPGRLRSRLALRHQDSDSSLRRSTTSRLQTPRPSVNHHPAAVVVVPAALKHRQSVQYVS